MRYKMERKQKKLTLTEKAPEKGDRFEFFHNRHDPSVIIQSEEEDERSNAQGFFCKVEYAKGRRRA